VSGVEDAVVKVGIETDRGPWAQALIAAGYEVFAVNPLQAARYRERHSVSGAKSDKADAHTLADMVRTDSHQLRPVAADTPRAEAIKVVARAHKTLIWERTRHSSGCGTRCGSTSRPRWRRSRIWRRATPWSCCPRPPIRPRRLDCRSARSARRCGVPVGARSRRRPR
jgi:transposase